MLVSITMALILASDAPAQTSGAGSPVATSTATTSKSAASSGDKIVCWTESPLGSRVPKRLCATQAQLDDMQTRAHDYKNRRDLDAGVPVRMGGSGGPR